jgi:hypothetical protein
MCSRNACTFSAMWQDYSPCPHCTMRVAYTTRANVSMAGAHRHCDKARLSSNQAAG